MISNSRTAAPRSTVVHATDGGFTVCGRAIGENWAGEYNEQPTEDVNCARCIKGCEAVTADLAARAKFAVGQRVGIVTGVQGPNGGTVTRYGTVIGHREFWKGTVEYIVSEDDGSELAYRAYLLSDDVSRDVAPITAAAVAAGIPVGTDGWPIVGHPVWKMNADGTGDLVATIGEWVKRARSMSAHPAGKGRGTDYRVAIARIIAGEYVADRLTGDSVRVLARSYPRVIATS